MLPKLLEKTKRPPPDFSGEEWKLISSFNVTRTSGINSGLVDLKYFKASLHNCVETPLTEETKYGYNNFVKVSIYRFKKRPQFCGCAITFFGQSSPVAVLTGFDGDRSPALYIRDQDIWYYRKHIRGIEFFPVQPEWDKEWNFEDAVLRVTGARGEEGIYLIVKKELQAVLA